MKNLFAGMAAAIFHMGGMVRGLSAKETVNIRKSSLTPKTQ